MTLTAPPPPLTALRLSCEASGQRLTLHAPLDIPPITDAITGALYGLTRHAAQRLAELIVEDPGCPATLAGGTVTLAVIG